MDHLLPPRSVARTRFRELSGCLQRRTGHDRIDMASCMPCAGGPRAPLAELPCRGDASAPAPAPGLSAHLLALLPPELSAGDSPTLSTPPNSSSLAGLCSPGYAGGACTDWEEGRQGGGACLGQPEVPAGAGEGLLARARGFSRAVLASPLARSALLALEAGRCHPATEAGEQGMQWTLAQMLALYLRAGLDGTGERARSRQTSLPAPPARAAPCVRARAAPAHPLPTWALHRNPAQAAAVPAAQQSS